MASYTFKGTKITGTSTTALPFRNSGITKFQNVGDTYYNKKTGRVYVCTSSGYAKDTKKDKQTVSAAKWRYDHTEIIKKPAGKVKSLTAPERDKNGSYKFTTKWSVEPALVDSTSNCRATGLRIIRAIEYKVGKNGKKTKKIEFSADSDTRKESCVLNVDSNGVAIGSAKAREAFWPYTSNIITGITTVVRAKNGNGLGPEATQTRKIYAPLQPDVATPVIDTDAGCVTCEITPYDGKGIRERLRTHWQIAYKDIGAGAKNWTYVEGNSTSDQPFTVTSPQLAYWMSPAHHYLVWFRAKSEGWGGESSYTSWKKCGVGFPKPATLGSISIPKPKDMNSYGFLGITSVNSDEDYPVDQVVLQALINTACSTAAAAAASNGWEDLDSKDDGTSGGLSFLIGDVYPETAGRYTWLRVKSWRGLESSFSVFSAPKELTALRRKEETAADNECAIVRVSTGQDGESLVAVVAWDLASSDSDDETTAMQLSWADDADAWGSTKPPEPFEFDWKDDSVDSEAAQSGWAKSATVKLKDLSEGVEYFIRARCVADIGDVRTFGKWCNMASLTTTVAPADAVLAAPSVVAEGSGIPFSWGFTGGTRQVSWAIVDNISGTPIASGETEAHAATVDAARAAAFAVNGIVEAFVRVDTAGGQADSKPIKVAIAPVPVLAIGTIGDLAAQPLEIPLVCSAPGCDILVTVAAQGCDSDAPGGTLLQAGGDTVWSDRVSPEWEVSNGSYLATLVLPIGLDFVDIASYDIEAQAVDTSTGLLSQKASAKFNVAWGHQAPVPSDSIVLEPEVSVDEDGNTVRSVSITFAEPDGAAEGDVYDLYRMTGDGAQLIAEGIPLDGTARDAYAPFGEITHFYRIACRTSDGDTAWRDYDYQSDGPGLRFDFDGDEHSYVELNWNVREQYAYAKDFELSKALDGTRAGAWRQGVEKRGTFQTDVVRIDEQETIEAIQDLARCTDAVFVRTVAGLAFAANVDVDSMEIDGSSKAIAVSFTATEIDPDRRFAAELPQGDPEDGGDEAGETGETGETGEAGGTGEVGA